jgi:hypothetical protein
MAMAMKELPSWVLYGNVSDASLHMLILIYSTPCKIDGDSSYMAAYQSYYGHAVHQI